MFDDIADVGFYLKMESEQKELGAGLLLWGHVQVIPRDLLAVQGLDLLSPIVCKSTVCVQPFVCVQPDCVP